MNAILDSLVSAAAWTLRNSLEASLLMIAFLLLASLGGARLAPRFRAALWILVGARLLLPFAPESTLSVFNLLPESEAAIHAPQGSSIAVDWEHAVAVPESGTTTSTSWSFTSAFSLIWVAGVLAILGLSIARQTQTARRVRRLPAVSNPALRELLDDCSRGARVALNLKFVEAPGRGGGVAIFGFLRATHLIVPAGLGQRFTEDEIRGIFLHELEHVRRRDLLWNWAALVVEAIHWFNPLVWLAGRRFRADREVICDGAALKGLPRDIRQGYGATLVKALELGRRQSPSPALVPFISRKTELTHRLTMITKTPRQGFLVQLTAAALALAVSTVTFTSATADEKEERRTNREETRTERTERKTETRETQKEGDREGEARREGDQPREGEAKREGPREGDRKREDDRSADRMSTPIVQVYEKGIVFGDELVRNEEVSTFLGKLARRPSSVVITARPEVPYGTVINVVNALEKAGISQVQFRGAGEKGKEQARDGDGAMREGPRDGDSPKGEGPRDGEGVKREGPRDGDSPKREGPRDGEGVKREGPRDGDSPKGEGPRDGEGVKREGPRDGDSPKREGSRGGEGVKREGGR